MALTSVLGLEYSFQTANVMMGPITETKEVPKYNRSNNNQTHVSGNAAFLRETVCLSSNYNFKEFYYIQKGKPQMLKKELDNILKA